MTHSLAFRLCLAISALPLFAACSMDPVHVEEDFGASVRQMVAAQIEDVDAASNPPLEGPTMLDGVLAEEAITGYREDAKREEDDPPSFTFDID